MSEPTPGAGTPMAELLDDLLPAQNIYAQEVVAAELAYRDAVKAAWETRKQRIDRALATCLEAMKPWRGAP